MFYNLKIAIRNLRSNGIYSMINMIGLSVSLATCILILFWIVDELSYDRFYNRSKDIYLVTTNMNNEGKESFGVSTPTAVSYYARTEIPGVENACAVNMNYDLGYVGYNDKKFFENRFIAADTTFFRIFDVRFIEGSANQAWPDPYSVVLTQSMAKKIFGNEPALGKELSGGNSQMGSNEIYYVSAVIADQPKNSELQYDAIFSFERSRHKNTWINWSWRNFFLLRPDADKNAVAQQLLESQEKNFSKIKLHAFGLQPLADLRLHAPDGKESGMASVRLFSIVALSLLVIACINYVNLTTARANKRNKEIGVKKILGAPKRKLFGQLMNETLILITLSLVIALFLVFLLIPSYNNITGKHFVFNPANPIIWGTCGCMLLFVTLFSGVYPTLKLSSFHPVQSLRMQPKGGKVGFSLRKILVVFQFVTVAVFITSAIVVNSQLHYIQHKQLGYDREQVLEMNVFTNLDIRTHYDSFKSELEKEPAIAGVTGSQGSILYAGGWETVDWEGKSSENQIMTAIWETDRNFSSIMNMKLTEGPGYTGTPADSSFCLVNETAIKQIGMENPVGKRISIPMRNQQYTIAGVIKDFHFEPLNSVIGPLIMHLSPRAVHMPSMNAYSYSTIYVKTQPGKTQEAVVATEKVWKKISPAFPLTYRFLDDAFNEMYRSESQKGQLFSFFSVISVLISCLGLFGLVTYTAETKTKEIGIRKILGASVSNIVRMLSKEFLILVGIAMLIAFPLAYYWLDKMLQDYAYRIGIGWWIFALAGMITIVLTLLTVGWQAVKAATSNPVKSIKTE